IYYRGKEIAFYYKRCEKKNLRCFIDTTSNYYASYISIKAKYSLFISKEE
ncbi:hypothetical protein COCHEDRAFT_1089305, partial [Bipolaris maydis C5]